MAAITEFVSSYSQQGTRKNYRSALRKFLSWKYKHPISGLRCTSEEDEFFEKRADEYIHTPQEYSKDILAFISDCNNKKIPPKSVRNWTSIIREWLSYNEIPVNDFRIRKKLPKGSGLTQESIPDIKQIAKIVSHAKFIPKFLILLLCSTGLRINEALNLHISDITDKNGIGVVKLKAKFTKTKNSRTVYFTPEVLEMYHIWIEREREVYIKSSSGRRSMFSNKQTQDRVFPFHVSTADTMLETTLNHSGTLDFHEESTIDGRKKKTIHFHLFRKFFDTTASLNGMPDSVRLSIMGHQKTGMDQIYLQVPDAVKEREFRKLVPKLTILQDLEAIAERDEYKTKFEKTDDNVHALVDEMVKMREKIKFLENIVNAVASGSTKLRVDGDTILIEQ